MLIKVRNLLSDSALYSFISQSQSAGVSTVPVKNINSFQASWAIQIGKTGEELSEVKLITSSAPSGTALLLTANTAYAHATDTPVYAIKYDQIVFERSTAGTAGTATPMTGGTVTITPDSDFTQYDDTTGASTYAYRTYFQNSVTAAVSAESDWLTPAGFSFYSLASIRDRIKRKLFSSNYIKDDKTIDDWINEWYELMNNEAIHTNQEYSLGTANVAFGTSGLGTITMTDYKDVYRFWVTYDNVNSYMAAKQKTNNIYPDDTFNTTHPYYSWRGDSVFEIKPINSGGTAQLIYYKTNAPLVNDTDQLPSSMQAYSASFVNYGMAEAYYKDEKDDQGDRYLNRAQAAKKEFITQITPRSFTGPQFIDFTDAINADDGTFEMR